MCLIWSFTSAPQNKDLHNVYHSQFQRASHQLQPLGYRRYSGPAMPQQQLLPRRRTDGTHAHKHGTHVRPTSCVALGRSSLSRQHHCQPASERDGGRERAGRGGGVTSHGFIIVITGPARGHYYSHADGDEQSYKLNVSERISVNSFGAILCVCVCEGNLVLHSSCLHIKLPFFFCWGLHWNT